MGSNSKLDFESRAIIFDYEDPISCSFKFLDDFSRSTVFYLGLVWKEFNELDAMTSYNSWGVEMTHGKIHEFSRPDQLKPIQRGDVLLLKLEGEKLSIYLNDFELWVVEDERMA